MRRTLFTTASFALALAVLAAPGCRRERGHSQAFEEASALFRKVYAEKLDDAYDDPRTQEVERLLSVVPPQSIDAPAAKELRDRIAAGRAALLAAREQPAVEEAPPPPEDPWARPDEPPPPPPGPPDAGPDQPVNGMTVEELRSRFSTCFAFKQSVRIPDRGRHDIWALNPTDACVKAHPGFDKHFIILDEAGKKIEGFAPTSALETRYYYPDGGQAPPPKK